MFRFPSDYERKDHVTKLSYLAARPSLALRTLRVLIFFFFFFFCPTDRPTFTRGRAMGNETFYWDGPTRISTFPLDCKQKTIKLPPCYRESRPRYVLLQLFLAHLCQYKLMAPKSVLELDISTVILVTLHVLRDTNGVEALREHVKPTDNGQERKPLVKVYS